MNKKIVKVSKISKIIFMLTITLILTIGITAVTFGATDPTLDLLKKYNLVNTYDISNTKSGDSGNLLNTKATIILGTDLFSSYMINVSDFKASEGTITKDLNGIYTLTDIISSIAPNTSHSITIERTFTTGTIDYNIDKSTITSDYSGLPNYTDYLKADTGVETNNAGIQAKAKILTNGITNTYDKAFAIFRFVNTSMTYNLDPKYANKGALSALTYKQGVCEDYSKLFVALCRASGIPSRTVSGYRNWQPGDSTSVDLTQLLHMWAEVYFPNYGWTIAEPTVEFSSGAAVSDGELMNYFGKALNPAEHIAVGYDYKDTTTISSNYERTTISPPILSTTSYATLYVIDDDLAVATKAVVKAETSKLQVDVDSASVLVNALPTGENRTALTFRLDLVQNAITNETQVEYQKIVNATSLTATVYLLPTMENYNKALDAVSDLKSGGDKTTLLTKLESILKSIQDNIARSKFPSLTDSPFLSTKDTSKKWDIKLSQAIDEKTVTTNNISMKDSKGNSIDFNVYCNGTVMTIIPINKFEIGEQYVVYISEKVLSINGKGIKNGYYFTFEIN